MISIRSQIKLLMKEGNKIENIYCCTLDNSSAYIYYSFHNLIHHWNRELILLYIEIVIIRLYLVQIKLQMFCSCPYLCEVWHCRDVNIGLIRCVITSFNWERAFTNTDRNRELKVSSELFLIFSVAFLHIRWSYVMIKICLWWPTNLM